MKYINAELLDSLTAKAKESPRKRAHHNLHPELNDPVQRLCIAMEPDTYIRPHRHSDPESWEVLTILRGSLALLFFDDQGNVLERLVLRAGGNSLAVEFPKESWHAPISLESGTVVFEVKKGPYKAPEMFPWSPAEGTSEACQLLQWYRNAKPGDTAPGC